VVDRDEVAAQEARDAIRAVGAQAWPYDVDLRDASAVADGTAANSSAVSRNAPSNTGSFTSGSATMALMTAARRPR